MINITEEEAKYISRGKPVPELRDCGLEAACESVVLLKNEKNALPMKKSGYAFFGRMQNFYLKSGTGSGGNVNCGNVIGINSAMKALSCIPDAETESLYAAFVEAHPYDKGNGWWQPYSQTELVPDESFVVSAASRCDTALYSLTRTAGEDRDASAGKGSYYLSDDEEKLLTLLRRHFKKVIVVLNICAVMDMNRLTELCDGLLCLWQAGMDGAVAAAKALVGEINPSGHLPDTVLATLENHPSNGFGSDGDVFYTEDIYVGYRYFNTFSKRSIKFPFGYGLSYTSFSHTVTSAKRADGRVTVEISVKNTGAVPGKDVAQVYASCPQGKLGKPEITLCGFAKTKELAPGESETLCVEFGDYAFASYDDVSLRGYLLEKGVYTVYAATDSLTMTKALEFALDEDEIIKPDAPVMMPLTPYKRMVNRDGAPVLEDAPVAKEYYAPEKQADEARTDDFITLYDVADGKRTLKELVLSLSDEDLTCLVRGEGMSSPKGTPGAASVFGGVTDSLRERKIPVMCCTDGPSGVRLSSTAMATALPSCTALAATFNVSLVCRLFRLEGFELISHDSDLLLGPGINIHRTPLCGRNFEYMSEDPVLAGEIASAVCKGLASAGVSGVIKHFMCNNQEAFRHSYSAVVSERAIREIYAKPFEIAVKSGAVASVMTSYNRINGLWAASNPGLCTGLLRKSFGFGGFVMTDWWAKLNDEDGSACVTNLKAMVEAQNDVYMVTPDALTREDNLVSSLSSGALSRGNLRLCAENILAFALNSFAFAKARTYGEQGVSDLRRDAESGAPFAVFEPFGSKCSFTSDVSKQVIAKITFESKASGLEQASARLSLSGKSACSFTVGAGITAEYRLISLLAAENVFEIELDASFLSVLKLELFDKSIDKTDLR